MKKLLAAVLIASSLFITSPVNAEVKTYEGSDEYVMSEFETIDIAKQRARQKAERNAQEQAGVFINSYSKAQNFELVEDEIISITCGILSVVDVQYTTETMPDVNGFIIRATVKVNIETDDVGKWLEKSARERSAIVLQNNKLRQAVAEQDEQIAKLKAQIEILKAEGKLNTESEREKISKEIAAEDKIFLSNQKLESFQKFYYEGDYQSVIRICNEALEINPNNEKAYALRGVMYSTLRNYDAAISDFSKAIEINPNYDDAYNERGIVYKDTANYSQAFADYDKAISLNPNKAEFYVNRGTMYLLMSKFNEALADANKSLQLKEDFAEAYALRAGAYLELGGVEAETILNDLNKAIELNPNLAFAYYCRAIFWQAVGDEARAQADFDIVRALSGNG